MTTSLFDYRRGDDYYVLCLGFRSVRTTFACSRLSRSIWVVCIMLGIIEIHADTCGALCHRKSHWMHVSTQTVRQGCRAVQYAVFQAVV